MVGTICLVSQSRKEFALHFDNFLVERIASQLQNFYTQGQVFNYQTLLMILIITGNMETLQQMDPAYFSDQVDLIERNSTVTFFDFTNRIMAAIYKLIFDSTMLRIQEDFKLLVQNPVEAVGDWFCYQDFTILRVYGFEGEPYKLPKFLTRRIFVFKFLR